MFWVQVQLHPGVLQHLLTVQPLVGVCNQDSHDEILGFFGHILPCLYIEIVFAVFDLLKKSKVVVLIKWWGTWEQDVSDNSNAPVIARFAIGSLHKDLGGYITRCTACCTSEWVLLQQSCQTKICNFEWSNSNIFIWKQKIFWLDISVGDAFEMAILNCINDRFDGLSSLILWKMLLLQDLVEEFSSLHKLHN